MARLINNLRLTRTTLSRATLGLVIVTVLVMDFLSMSSMVVIVSSLIAFVLPIIVFDYYRRRIVASAQSRLYELVSDAKKEIEKNLGVHVRISIQIPINMRTARSALIIGEDGSTPVDRGSYVSIRNSLTAAVVASANSMVQQVHIPDGVPSEKYEKNNWEVMPEYPTTVGTPLIHRGHVAGVACLQCPHRMSDYATGWVHHLLSSSAISEAAAKIERVES